MRQDLLLRPIAFEEEVLFSSVYISVTRNVGIPKQKFQINEYKIQGNFNLFYLKILFNKLFYYYERNL